MKNPIKLFISGIVVFLILLMVLAVCLKTVVDEIDQQGGLKSVIERIWEGKSPE